MENKLKEYKRIRRIRQEYFAVYGEYANRHKTEDISANFLLKPKKIPNHHSRRDQMRKKPSHVTVPLKGLSLSTGSVGYQRA
jgi:hypothetical protein